MQPWTRLLALTTQFHTHTMPSPSSFAIIVGVGPGTGATVARKFAASYPVALLARNPANYEDVVKEIQSSGGKAIGISTDVADAASVKSAFSKISSEFGDSKLAAAVYNVGGGFIRKGFLDLTQEEFESGWEANGYNSFGPLHFKNVSANSPPGRRGAFLFSQSALPLLLASTNPPLQHPPTLIFTGATAGFRGSALCASFSTGKFALRSLSQSLAREFGPKGVHIAHANIDGVIDIPRTKEWLKDLGPEAKIKPEAVSCTDIFFI
ncbi:MAG: hypothetical protein LQ342_008336 [Letrouitia transgressa]|nr:MAG: hypothetical protein LQ342_008336 [Letrouitia transgressa]